MSEHKELISLEQAAKQLAINEGMIGRQKSIMVDLAIESGLILNQVKEQLPHGAFQNWVEENCPVSLRQAQKYLKLAKQYGSKNELSSLLDINAECALLLIDDSSRDELREEIRELSQQDRIDTIKATAQHEKTIEEIEADYQAKLSEAKAEYDRKIAVLNENIDRVIDTRFNESVDDLKAEFQKKQRHLEHERELAAKLADKELAAKKKLIQQADEQIKSVTKQIEKLNKDNQEIRIQNERMRKENLKARDHLIGEDLLKNRADDLRKNLIQINAGIDLFFDEEPTKPHHSADIIGLLKIAKLKTTQIIELYEKIIEAAKAEGLIPENYEDSLDEEEDDDSI